MEKNIKNKLIDEFLSWKLNEYIHKKKYYKSKRIPNIFESIEDYKKKFEPLLLEEIREQIKHLFIKNKNFKDGKNGEICIQFVNNNKFFLTVFLPLDSVNQFQKGILVLIYISVYNLKKKIEKKLIFGIISEIDHYCHILKIEIGLKNRHIFLNPRKKVFELSFSQITNINSYIKEYNVIYSLEKIPIKIRNIILDGSNYQKIISIKKSNNLFECHLKIHFNQSQVNAISTIIIKEISLIQGPPGTGKTRTILGIISLMLLDSRVNLYSQKIFKKKIQM